MLPFHKILFPVDYSAPCQAVDSLRSGNGLPLLGGADGVPRLCAPGRDRAERIAGHRSRVCRPRHATWKKDRLRQFAAQVFPGQQVDAVVELGEPGSVIDRVAEQQRADLVMLATRGHGPVRRFLLGSITAKVLHDVGAAVWTGVGAELSGHPVHIPYQSIVCALDDSLEAESVLRAAASIASAYGAQLWILHVVPTPSAYPDSDLDRATHGSFAGPVAGTQGQVRSGRSAYRDRRAAERWHPSRSSSQEGRSADHRPRALDWDIQPTVVAPLFNHSRLSVSSAKRLNGRRHLSAAHMADGIDRHCSVL